MGKKHKHGKGGHGGGFGGGGGGFPLAGLVAAAAAQANSPAGREMIAGALRKAADALDRRGGAPRAPVPPVPPVAPAANDAPGAPGAPEAGEAPGARRKAEGKPGSGLGDLPPEVAKVIGSITAGVERWAAGMSRPK